MQDYKLLSDQFNQQEFKTSDTISELDEYLHDAIIQQDDESQLIERSLNQNYLS